jgi:hypothetical protein
MTQSTPSVLMPLTNGNLAQPLQSNSEDDQIYEIDIDQIYADYIQAVDSARSYVNVINQNTAQLLAAIGGNPESPTVNNLVPAKTYQESRCHAFFRIIGFPVVASNKGGGTMQFYNPGHDIIYGQRSLTLPAKIAIANNPIDGFIALSNEREQYFQRQLKIFSIPTSVDAGVLALSGGANAAGQRKFNSPFVQNTLPFDMNFSHQNYPGVYTSIVGGGKRGYGSQGDSTQGAVTLNQYYDASYNIPAAATLPTNKNHIILPFIVDPRIDFSCSPTTNRIGVPFVPNNSFLQISSTTYANPPILEIVIRDVFSVTNQLQSSSITTQQFATFITDVAHIVPDKSILAQINQNNVKQLTSNSQFVQFVNIIQAMIKKLVEAQKNIQGAQSNYYWLPVPATIGPEGGSTVQGVFLPPAPGTKATNNSSATISPLVPTNDWDILKSTAQSLFSQTQQNPQAASAVGQPDPGGFARSLKNSLGPASSSAFVNNGMATLDTLVSRRQSALSAASDSLRTVEIIMGEFSGLGLCDMIAVLGALYTMPPLSLLGFLDTDAFARFTTQFNIGTPGYTNPGLDKAMSDFCLTVSQFYQLMDAVYKLEATAQGID